MKPIPLQLELAIQHGDFIPWEFDPITKEFSWWELTADGPAFRHEKLDQWLQGVHPEDRAQIVNALDSPKSESTIEIEFRLNPSGMPRRIQAIGRTDTTGHITGVSIDLTKKLRLERRLQAQQEVTATLEQWTTLRGVSEKILKIVCEAQYWELGNMWSHDAATDSMVLLQSWWQPGLDKAALALTMRQSFTRGTGLPGKVWETGNQVWVPDIAMESDLPRITVAAEHGIRGASAFPVFLGSELFGVMEFFSRRVRRENPDVLAFLRAIGSQLGQVIERRRAETELRESEERHRTMSETASDAILTINEESTIIFVNPAVEQVFGYKMEELLGEKLTMLMPSPMRHRHLGGISRYLTTGIKGFPWRNVEMPGLHKSGRELQLELSFGEFKKDGKHFFTGVARDVSARKQAEEALKISEKLAATGRLAASMAHEINNPLTSVTNILYLLSTDAQLSGHNQTLVQTAQQELHRVAHIVKQTLGFYRESAVPVDTDLVEVVDGVMELFANQVRSRSIQVSRRFRVTKPVQSLPGEIRQVIANLIENALQATPVRGKLALRLEDAVEHRHPHRKGVRFVVADNGSGIVTENQAKIFEPFFTTKGEKGTGLGLWVTRGIIEKHGGTIRLKSSVKLGRSGTCFAVFLPSISRIVSASAAA